LFLPDFFLVLGVLCFPGLCPFVGLAGTQRCFKTIAFLSVRGREAFFFNLPAVPSFTNYSLGPSVCLFPPNALDRKVLWHKKFPHFDLTLF